MIMTKPYYKFGDDGRFISTLHLDDEEANLQGNLAADAPNTPPGTHPWRVNGGWEYRPERPAVTSPGDRRRQLYPPISEQLDMLWHAMDRGELPVASGFYESIKLVKDAHPKNPVVFDVGLMPEA